MTRLVEEGGIVAPTGKPGGVLMFHGNLVHGSAGNITPYPRKIVYLTLNAVSNYIRTPTRPEWIAHRDFTPIEPVADDALLHLRARWSRRRLEPAYSRGTTISLSGGSSAETSAPRAWVAAPTGAWALSCAPVGCRSTYST